MTPITDSKNQPIILFVITFVTSIKCENQINVNILLFATKPVLGYFDEKYHF